MSNNNIEKSVQKIWINQARCLICFDVVQSLYLHDYKECKCGNLSVDGGNIYISRTFKKYMDKDLTIPSYTDCNVIEYIPRLTPL